MSTTQNLVEAVNAKPMKEITVTEARQVGHNVAPGSTAGHYVVKAANVDVIDEADGRFLATPTNGELGLVTDKHGCATIQTTEKVGFFRQNEVDHFQGIVVKSQD